MVLEHVRRLDGVVIDADQDHVFFVHGQSSPSLIHLSDSDAPLPRGIGKPTPGRQDHYFENYLLAQRESTSSGRRGGPPPPHLGLPGQMDAPLRSDEAPTQMANCLADARPGRVPNRQRRPRRRQDARPARIPAVGIDQPTESCKSIG
jgi:hypothetical protein